jgi:hypothetical protein
VACAFFGVNFAPNFPEREVPHFLTRRVFLEREAGKAGWVGPLAGAFFLWDVGGWRKAGQAGRFVGIFMACFFFRGFSDHQDEISHDNSAKLTLRQATLFRLQYRHKVPRDMGRILVFAVQYFSPIRCGKSTTEGVR